MIQNDVLIIMHVKNVNLDGKSLVTVALKI